MEEGREYQTEAYAQEGVHHAQDDRPLKSVNSGAQHQRAEAVHGCFVPVIRAEAQAQPAQRPHQRVEGLGRCQIKQEKCPAARRGAHKPLPEADGGSVMSVNLKSMLFTTQAALGHMLKKGKGAIVNLASVSGQMGNVGQSNYAASKAGVEALTRTLCLEYAAKGIRINAVAPGFTYSEMTKAIPETVVEAMLKKIPMRRGAEPQEIARAILFLASEDASFINGQTLSVNGGMFFS